MNKKVLTLTMAVAMAASVGAVAMAEYSGSVVKTKI